MTLKKDAIPVKLKPSEPCLASAVEPHCSACLANRNPVQLQLWLVRRSHICIRNLLQVMALKPASSGSRSRQNSLDYGFSYFFRTLTGLALVNLDS
jgi:hypothetical protein